MQFESEQTLTMILNMIQFCVGAQKDGKFKQL